MKKKLYFTIEKELDSTERITGNKLISVYEVVDNEVKNFCLIDAVIEDDTFAKIQEYLDDNGFGDDEFVFEQL